MKGKDVGLLRCLERSLSSDQICQVYLVLSRCKTTAKRTSASSSVQWARSPGISRSTRLALGVNMETARFFRNDFEESGYQGKAFSDAVVATQIQERFHGECCALHELGQRALLSMSRLLWLHRY